MPDLNCGGIVAKPEEKATDMSNGVAVRPVSEEWAGAVSAGDRPAILAYHARDLRMCDVVDPMRGLDDFDHTWDKSRAGSAEKEGQR